MERKKEIVMFVCLFVRGFSILSFLFSLFFIYLSIYLLIDEERKEL